MPPRVFIRVIVASLVLFACACSKPETPEQRIRAMLSSAEQAAENKDVRALRGYVSERYADAEGRDRRTIDGILRLYVFRNETIHLLTRIDSIALTSPAHAEIVVYVAMAARPITDQTALAAFHASLYRFDLGLVKEDSAWRVLRAAWRPAELSDFSRR